jgi:hypothetical protein
MTTLTLDDPMNCFGVMKTALSRVTRGLALLWVAGVLASCGSSEPLVSFSTDFESGSIGVVTPLDAEGRAWQLALRDDNDNASLPNSFRTWWHVRADHVPVGQSLRLEFSRLGFPYYFVPVYSYDGTRWQHFAESEVALVPGCVIAVPDSCRVVVTKRFDAPTVWIARTFPYTTRDLSTFLAELAPNPAVRIETLGLSPVLHKPLQLITIADPAVSGPRKTVWIHARTHAAETGPSFVLEGLIRSVLADDELGRALRAQYVFRIVPMHNVDGAYVGNYRTNATSINLENMWLNTQGTLLLDANAPLENRLLNQFAMVPALQDAAAPVVLALNLHSSNSEPDTAPFFFPHFGSDPVRYTPAQRALWSKQIAFITEVARYFDGRIEQPPADGGAGFLNSWFPETWWWNHAQEAVNAITLETTYGRAGFDHWIQPPDLRNLGVAVARAIRALAPQASGIAFKLPEPAPEPFRLPYKPQIYLERE